MNGIRLRLWALLAALLSVAVSCGTTTSADRSFTTDAMVPLRTYTALVEQHLISVLASLTAVAATDAAGSGQWDRIRPALARVESSTGTTAAVWYKGAGRTVLFTRSSLTGWTFALGRVNR